MGKINSKLHLIALCVFAVIGFQQNAVGISRIGGGRISSDYSMYETNLTKDFPGVEGDWSSTHAKLIGTIFSPSRGLSPLEILFFEFYDRYPQLVDQNRLEIQRFFIGHGWSKLSAPSSCIDAYIKTNGKSYNLVGTWGEGKGMVLVGRSYEVIYENMLLLLGGIVLNKGACSW